MVSILYTRKDILLKNTHKATLIVNPKAGKQISQNVSDTLSSALSARGCDVDVIFTERQNHATELAKMHAPNSDIIICCGGDGTLNETVSGLASLDNSSILGYIPLGTTNDFAKTLKLPKNIDDAVDIISNGQTRQIDIGLLNKEKYFTYVVSFGAFSSVPYETSQEAKNKYGHAAYIIDGIKSLGDIHTHKATITADGKTYSGNYIFGAISNTVSMGGILKYKEKDVVIDDGLFELLLIKLPKDLEELSLTVQNIFKKSFEDGDIVFTHAKNIVIELEEEIPFTADGEFAGNFTRVEIENLNKKLKLLVK